MWRIWKSSKFVRHLGVNWFWKRTASHTVIFTSLGTWCHAKSLVYDVSSCAQVQFKSSIVTNELETRLSQYRGDELKRAWRCQAEKIFSVPLRSWSLAPFNCEGWAVYSLQQRSVQLLMTFPAHHLIGIYVAIKRLRQFEAIATKRHPDNNEFINK